MTGPGDLWQLPSLAVCHHSAAIIISFCDRVQYLKLIHLEAHSTVRHRLWATTKIWETLMTWLDSPTKALPLSTLILRTPRIYLETICLLSDVAPIWVVELGCSDWGPRHWPGDNPLSSELCHELMLSVTQLQSNSQIIPAIVRYQHSQADTGMAPLCRQEFYILRPSSYKMSKFELLAPVR